MKKRSVVTKETDEWTYGTDFFEDGREIEWMKLTERYYEKRLGWIVLRAENIFRDYNWSYVDHKQINDLIKVCDENVIDLIYFIYSFADKSEEMSIVIINWILGPIAEWMKMNHKSFREFRVHRSAIELKSFYEKVVLSDGFMKSKTKEALRKWLDCETLKKEDFWTNPGFDLKSVVDEVFIENSAKIANGNQKIDNWLVGQVMKKVSGSADPAVVREIVTSKLKGQ